MVAKLTKYLVFAGMVAIWLVARIRDRRRGIKPDPEKAKQTFDKTIKGVLGDQEEETAQ